VEKDACEGSDSNGDVIPQARLLLFLRFRLSASSLSDTILVAAF
jgi:hypothetical protein